MLVKHSRLVFGFVMALILPSQLALPQEKKGKAKIEIEPHVLKLFEPRQFSDADGKLLNYRLMKPIDYRPGKRYPLVIFLHGAGERGDDNTAQLKHGARDFADEERRRQYPAYVLVPQCPQDKKWVEVDWKEKSSRFSAEPSESMRLVKALVDTMIDTAGIDPQRIYITGLSMGGYGTWDAIARYENFFAAAAPICGGGDPETASRFAQLPLWCFHGAKDPVVLPERSQKMVEALKAHGSRVQYTEYPDATHDSWTQTYANPEFYAWMFAQEKP